MPTPSSSRFDSAAGASKEQQQQQQKVQQPQQKVQQQQQKVQQQQQKQQPSTPSSSPATMPTTPTTPPSTPTSPTTARLTIHVGNLPPFTSAADLAAVLRHTKGFQTCCVRGYGEPRGSTHGFARFATPEEARAAARTIVGASMARMDSEKAARQQQELEKQQQQQQQREEKVEEDLEQQPSQTQQQRAAPSFPAPPAVASAPLLPRLKTSRALSPSTPNSSLATSLHPGSI